MSARLRRRKRRRAALDRPSSATLDERDARRRLRSWRYAIAYAGDGDRRGLGRLAGSTSRAAVRRMHRRQHRSPLPEPSTTNPVRRCRPATSRRRHLWHHRGGRRSAVSSCPRPYPRLGAVGVVAFRTRRGGGASGAASRCAARASGLTFSSTTLPSTTQRPMSDRLGRSYMISSSTSSRIARRPRAPVPRSSAWSAIASSASSANSSSTSSNSKNLRYCLISAFFGSTRMRMSASRSRFDTAPMTGRRPMNSGMRPNFRRSSGSTFSRMAPMSFSSARRMSAPKPTPLRPMRLSMIFSMPANAPPQMNRMLVVSIWMNSWCGCLRPPCGGTDAVVPSRIFSSACCTPSPETSRVIDGFSDLRAILSISSM